MKIIGFDFGTTNSTISFLSEINGKLTPKSFERDTVLKEDYIPSVIAYSTRNDQETLIGIDASHVLYSIFFMGVV